MKLRLLLTTVFTLVVGLLIVGSVLGKNIKISNWKAISIALEEAKKLGYQAEYMHIEARLYRTYWNRIFPKDTTSDYDLKRQDKLKGRIYLSLIHI